MTAGASRRVRALIPFILTGLLGAAQTARAQQTDTVALERELPRLMEIGDVPGLSIAVLDGGEIFWSGAFGTLGDSAGTPVSEETVFSAASLSKPVFAYVVLRLAERDLIDLDRPLAEVLDDPRITHDPRGRRITPRMVLSHGTGLPNWGGERLELQFDPGAGFNYSGEGYVYLQRVVERTTGLSLEELARREVFEPLGMTRTSFVWQERFAGNAVYGKDWAWRTEHVERYEEPNAAYSLLTTARDYARFMAAVLQGTGLSAESHRRMLTPERPARRSSRPTPADDHVAWGLGWGLQEGAAGPAIWHWGDNGRFKAYVVAYPEDSTGVVYLANANDGLSIAEAIVSRVVDDDHRALQWLDYDRHDDPERLTVKSVQRAAVERGAEEAVARYRTARSDPESPLGLDASLGLARFLDARDLDAAENSVLEIVARDHPDSARAHRALAEALLEAGDYDAALEAQRRELALAPDDEDARRRAGWIEERVAIRDHPVTLPISRLERYVGVYGPRRVWLEDGALHYRREGNPAYRLVPMAEDLFAVEGLATFRVRFVGADPGPATSIEGLYFDGSTDRTERADRSHASLEPHLFESNDGDSVRAELGRFRVPLNRSRGGADSLELAFVRFPATTPDPGPPIVYLAGGPGGSGIATARGSRFPLFMALREFGDVVAFDQRGTGMSDGPSPATCPHSRSYPADRPLERERLRELTLDVARRCGVYWRERGVDLSAYDARESADDVADLAAALEAPRLRLWAISYGTHLGLAVLRRHPDLVERAILAGVEGPDHTVKLPSYWSGQLDRLEELIANDPEASGDFPDLRGLIRNVLERLEREPAPVEMISADRADTIRSRVSAFAVRRRTIDLLRDPSSMVTVPHLYRRMAAGDVSPVAGGTSAGGLEAMPEATDAASGMSPERRARFLHEDSTTLLGGGDDLVNADMADALGVPDLGAAFRAPVQSDIPALFISGTLDGRTPVANAEEVLAGFPNGRHLVIANAGHSDDLFLSSPRILDVMRTFLADRPLPTTQLAVDPPSLEDGRLPPSLSGEFIDAITGAYERGPGDVWRVIRQGEVRSLDAAGRETGRTASLQVRLRGNGFPLEANEDTTFSIPVFGPDLSFRFVRDATGRVERLDFTNSAGETSRLTPVRWDEVAFVEGERWLMAGPYQLEPGQTCDRPFPVETETLAGSILPDAEAESWRVGAGDDGFVDFEEVFGGSAVGGVGYAHLTIEADASRTVQLRLGTDDDARVYLNGERVHIFDGARHAWEAQDTVPVQVHAGSNRLLVKICNRDSDWRFNLRISDAEGASVISESGPRFVRLRPARGAGSQRRGASPTEECAGQPGCPPLAITDVRVMPMAVENPGAVLADRTVLVRDGRIRSIAPADSISLPPATVELDGGDRYLMPGLADMHVHLEWAGRSSDLLAYLLQGVTTVRHTDGRPRELRWRDSIADGNLLGPTIHMAGPIINGEERGSYEVTAVATSPAEGRSAVAAQDSQGYDFVKVYDELRPDVFRAVVEEARSRGLQVSGHVPDRVGLREALEAGLSSVEHLNGYGAAVADADDASAADEWPEHHVAGRLDSTRLRQAVHWTRQSGTAVVPTLSVYQRHIPPEEMRRALRSAAMAWVPGYMLEAWGYMYYSTAFKSAEAFAAQRSASDNRRAVVRALHEAGVPILAGTDAPILLVVPGLALHRELELLVEAGLSSAGALRAATSAAAEFLGEEGDFGVVAEGARADLLLLEDNPLEDISATQSIQAVVVRGRWIGTRELEAMRDSVRRANRSLRDRATNLDPLSGPGRKLMERSFVVHFAGRPVGVDGFALFQTAGGDTVVIGRQVPSDPSGPVLRVTAEKSAGGPWRRLALEEEGTGGRRAVLRRVEGRLVLTGSDADGSTVTDTVSADGVHVLRGPGLSGAVPLAMRAGADSVGVVASVDLDPSIAVRRLETTVRQESPRPDCVPRSATRSVRVQLGSGPFGEEISLAPGSDGLPTAAVWQIPAGTFRVWPEGASPPPCAPDAW